MGIVDGIKNIFRRSEVLADELRRFFMMGLGSKFVTDIFKDRVLTPHEEMKEARRLYNRNAWVTSAVLTLKDMIVGDEITVETQDPALKQFMDSWMKNSGFKSAIAEVIEHALVTGNGYIEKIRSKSGKIVKVFPVPQPEYIYIDVDETMQTKGYIQEYPSKLKVWDTFTINYGGKMTTISGKYIPADKLVHVKFGMADIPFYGRSPVASVINDGRILLEIERSMAVFSRFKATPKKLISFPDANDTDVEKFQKYWKQMDDTENLITNLKPEVYDLSYTGATADMSNIVEYLKRKMTIALAPEYLIHGEDTNRATAKEQRIMTILRIQSIREQLAQPINKLLKEVAIQYGFEADVEIKFGSFDFDTQDEKIQKATNLYNSGIITLDEARKLAGFEPLNNEIGDSFKWELETKNPLDDLFSEYEKKRDQKHLTDTEG